MSPAPILVFPTGLKYEEARDPIDCTAPNKPGTAQTAGLTRGRAINKVVDFQVIDLVRSEVDNCGIDILKPSVDSV
jgi:hypothetical protein